eukprot:Skav228333  [mRNA]  locus=scaffold1898:31694:41271:- [translate_table: standard]
MLRISAASKEDIEQSRTGRARFDREDGDKFANAKQATLTLLKPQNEHALAAFALSRIFSAALEVPDGDPDEQKRHRKKHRRKKDSTAEAREGDSDGERKRHRKKHRRKKDGAAEVTEERKHRSKEDASEDESDSPKARRMNFSYDCSTAFLTFLWQSQFVLYFRGGSH